MAEEHKTTRERKCTECGNENFEFQGSSRAIGMGERTMRDHQFKCLDCETIFWYRAENP